MLPGQLDGSRDDLEILTGDGPQCPDDVGVDGEPVHRLAPGLEILNHRMESLGCSEVSLRDVETVDHDRQVAAALLHSGLVDEVPHVGDGGEDNVLVGGDEQVVLLGTRHLEHHYVDTTIRDRESQLQNGIDHIERINLIFWTVLDELLKVDNKLFGINDWSQCDNHPIKLFSAELQARL